MRARVAHGLHRDMVLPQVRCVLLYVDSFGLCRHRLPRFVDASFGPSFCVITRLVFTCSFPFVLCLHCISTSIRVHFIRFVFPFPYRFIRRQSASTMGSVLWFLPFHPARPRSCTHGPPSLFSFVAHPARISRMQHGPMHCPFAMNVGRSAVGWQGSPGLVWSIPSHAWFHHGPDWILFGFPWSRCWIFLGTRRETRRNKGKERNQTPCIRMS